ncbi:hypothetical protein ACHAXS_000663 [Conticribra weissflogii]
MSLHGINAYMDLFRQQYSNIMLLKLCAKFDSMVEKLTLDCPKNNIKGCCLCYVDENLIVGHPQAIKDTIEQLKKNGFVVKVENDLKDYCLMKSIQFQENTSMFWNYYPINEDEKVSSKKQKLHHSGVGMLLHLAEYSCPDIANAVWELFKVLDGANLVAYKEMFQVINYVLDTRDSGLWIEPK